MEQTKLIKKGTRIFIYEMDSDLETYLNIIEIVLGEDILKSDDDYVKYNGTMVISEAEIEDAVRKHTKNEYPKMRDYVFEIDDK
jgi:hypothetical protein